MLPMFNKYGNMSNCHESMQIATLRSNIIYPFEWVAKNRKHVSRIFWDKLIIVVDIDF